MGILYLVATPIGNLEDITLRALRLLRESVLIAAEDTRQTQKLLRKYEINTRVISYHEHNKIGRIDDVLGALGAGDVALVSDAGMPGLNDPGYELVQAALARGYTVSVAPGASSAVSALVVSGLPTDSFVYLGYLPRRSSERCTRLQEVAALPYTLIFLETPHRLLDALEDIRNQLGDRAIAIGRELTKLHEEIYRGSVSAARAHFVENPPRGEFTLVIAGAKAVDDEPWEEERVRREVSELLSRGEGVANAAADLASRSGWTRRAVYRLAQAVKEEDNAEEAA